MAIKLSTFVNPNNFSILVNFPGKLGNVKNTKNVGYVLDIELKSKDTVMEYLFFETKQSSEKIIQALQLVKLKSSLNNVSLCFLTNQEIKKVELAKVLLLQSKVIICEHFFKDLTFGEKEYFKRLFRNLMYKKNKSVILIENDMNFVVETVKSCYLFTNDGKYKYIDDFYEEKIYDYVSMPYTVELVKFLEKKGHQIDHDITFNETLKAIYRGVK